MSTQAQRTGVFTNLQDALGKPDEVQILRLANQNLKSLPEAVGEFRYLHTLEIQGNQISSLPASFSGLVNLKKLNISRNNFTELPAWLCLIPRVEEIDDSLGGQGAGDGASLRDWAERLHRYRGSRLRGCIV